MLCVKELQKDVMDWATAKHETAEVILLLALNG
jgi:hypothetical protein